MKIETRAAYPGAYREALRFHVTRAEEETLRAALATSQRRLGVALAQIERLLVNDRRQAEELAVLAQVAAKAEQFAHRDELTGLPNRRLLLERFNQAVAQANRQSLQVALLFMDIDGFKSINDRFGHAAGDSLLQQFAARLTACTRSSDTVCRFGGDEFVILLPAIGNQRSVTAAAQKIRAILVPPYTVAGTEIAVHASFGTAVYPVHGQAYLELIEASDREMYEKKRRAGSPRRLTHHSNPQTGNQS